VPTAAAFVYTVPDARMPTPATPLLTAADAFDLTAVPFAPPDTDPGPAERRPLVDWLANFFDSLLNRVAVLPGDTLPKIADRHGIEVAELAPAVADIPDLVPPETSLRLAGKRVRMGRRTLRRLADSRSVPPAEAVAAAAARNVALTPRTLVRPVANARYLRVGVDYGFAVATAVATAASTDPLAQQEIVSRLPVFLRPAFLFDSAIDLSADSGFCADLAERLTEWAAERGLPDDAGMWVLDVSLYTTVTDAPSVPDTTPPLLQLRDVRLRRDRIAPTPALMTPEETP
jgi:LysM repeat protein